MSIGLDQFLDWVVRKQCHELQLRAGQRPVVLLKGQWVPLYMSPLTPEDTLRLLTEIAPEERLRELKMSGACEFSHPFQGFAQFRVSARMTEGGCEFALAVEGIDEANSPYRKGPVTELDRRLSRRLDMPLDSYSSNLILARSVVDFVAWIGLRSEVLEREGRKVLVARNSRTDARYERSVSDDKDLPRELCQFILDVLEGAAPRSS